jgi:ABC-2 type transport system permease protein
MLVAPVGRGSIVLGKVAAGAVTASAQGLVILLLAGLAGVPYDVPVLLAVLGETLILAFTMAALGALLATSMKSVQGFMAVTQMSLMPLFFASGALFPVSGLPAWLRVITLVNPLTYAVDPIRRTVYGALHLSAAYPGVTWGSWTLPLGLELLVVALLGIAMLGGAIARFRRIQ